MVGAILTNHSPVDLTMVTPIARLTGEQEAIVVPAASDIQSVDDLVAKLKADPGAVSWGGGSAGGADHILAGLVAKAAGVDPTKVNYIAFSGGGEALAAILGGQVTVGVSGYGEFESQIEAGQLRLLAVSGDERMEGVDAPTLKEAGVDVALENWRMVAPLEPDPLPLRTKARDPLGERGDQGFGAKFALRLSHTTSPLGRLFKKSMPRRCRRDSLDRWIINGRRLSPTTPNSLPRFVPLYLT